MKQPYSTPTLTRNGQLYSGVVVGGPLAGRMLTSATRSYNQADAPQFPLALALAPGEAPVGEILKHRYRWTEMGFADGSGVGTFPMWLHDSVPTLAAALKILGDSYVKAQRKK